MTGDRHKCPVEGCDGNYNVDVVDTIGGGQVVTTCEHVIGFCAYCDRPVPAGKLVFYNRSDGYTTDKPTPIVHFCETCAAAGKVEEVPGWSV